MCKTLVSPSFVRPMVLPLEGALLTSNHKLPSNLVSKDSLNMMDNIPAMKMLQLQAFVGA